MPEKTVNIAFRGLMVLNYQGIGPNRYMEIGFLDARSGEPGSSHMEGMPDSSTIHVPRILTMENGILADLLDLRNRPDLLGRVRRWELRAVNPVGSEATLKGAAVDRTKNPTDVNREYFGWVINLEGADMHAKNLTRDISTARLLMVLKVANGEFSTKLISPFLEREELGVEITTPFGFAAAVTGLEIKCTVATDDDEAAVDLMAGGTLVRRLQPRKGRSTVFEISNAPPDVPCLAPVPEGAKGHFHMYYDKLFVNSPPDSQFDFVSIGAAPAPDPALCGVTFLSERTDGL